MGAHLAIGIVWVTGLVASFVEARFPRLIRLPFWLGVAALTGAIAMAGWYWPGEADTPPALQGVGPDGFGLVVQVFVFVGALCALLLGRNRPAARQPDRTGLLLMAAAGASMLGIASDIVGILAGFAAALIPMWGFCAISPGEPAREGALKGMVVGALALALFGLGAAMLAVRTGATDLVGIGHFLSCNGFIGSDPVLVVALACLLGGIGCFVAVVPFHMWFVDMIEAMPSPGALVLSGGVLTACLAAVCRLFLAGFHHAAVSGPGYLSWTAVLHGLGLVALLVGNALALVQRKFRRMAAYLAAGQAGLVLVTLAATGHLGMAHSAAYVRAVGGILVFLAVYAVNWVGLFVAAAAIEDAQGSDPGVRRLRGLARNHPWLAVAIGLALLCMAGMPLTAGFFSRLYLLEAMVDAGWTTTAVIAALSLGLVLVMGLGLVATMVMRAPDPKVETRATPWLGFVAIVASLTILVLGVVPGGMFDVAIRSAGSFLNGP